MYNELFLGDWFFSSPTHKEVAACFPGFGLMTSQHGLNEFVMGCAFLVSGTELECSFQDTGHTQLHT